MPQHFQGCHIQQIYIFFIQLVNDSLQIFSHICPS